MEDIAWHDADNTGTSYKNHPVMPDDTNGIAADSRYFYSFIQNIFSSK